MKKNKVKKDWYLIDGKDKILGRLATEAAKILRGKGKVSFSYNLDSGDYVVIINAKYIRLKGGKEKKKIYYHHTGYPGGLKETSFSELFSKDPSEVVKRAIWGMLPHTRLGRQIIKKLKVYPEDRHPYSKKQFKILDI